MRATRVGAALAATNAPIRDRTWTVVPTREILAGSGAAALRQRPLQRRSEFSKTMLKRLLERLGEEPRTIAFDGSDALEIGAQPARIEARDLPLRIEVGPQRLDVFPQALLTPGEQVSPSLLAVDPDRYFAGIGADLRLLPGGSCLLDPEQRGQEALYSHPDGLRSRRVRLEYDGEALVVRSADSVRPLRIMRLDEGHGGDRLRDRRVRALTRMVQVYGGGVSRLPADSALETLLAVNRLMLEEHAFVPRDEEGRPGGLVELPEALTPIFIGDLHGRPDNLLSALTSNGYLEALDAGGAVLVFLGDAVHSDRPGSLEAMGDSMLVMDLVFKLKLSFPRHVHFLLGNHDSFSTDVMKGGVAQGLLWQKALVEERGESYREAMAAFYALCPIAAASESYFACHAGPPRASIDRSRLIDFRSHPGLTGEILSTRCASPGYPQGYGAADVRRMRKGLGLERDAVLVVGHYPRSEEESFWLDSDRIEGHHVLFSARDREVGVMTIIDRQVVAQTYPVEALSALSAHIPRGA